MSKKHSDELDCISQGNRLNIESMNKKMKKKTEQFNTLQQEFEDLQAIFEKRKESNLLGIIARLENKFEQLSAMYFTTLREVEMTKCDIHERDEKIRRRDQTIDRLNDKITRITTKE